MQEEYKEGDIVLVKARIINEDANVNHLPALVVVPESEEGSPIDVCHNSMVIMPIDIVGKVVYHYCRKCGMSLLPLFDDDLDKIKQLNDMGYKVVCGNCGNNILTTVKLKKTK